MVENMGGEVGSGSSTRRHREGVFADNRRRPIHRWYPFVEGYSSALVERALDAAADTSSVFDPFGGSGTTALTAAQRGVDSSFTEANAYMAWVADVKVNQSAKVAASRAEIQRLRSIGARLGSAPQGQLVDHPLMVADGRREFFPPGTARQVVAALALIDEELAGEVRELARLAVATALVPSSNMLRRTDLRRRRGNEAPPGDFGELVATKVRDIADDIEKLDTTRLGTARNLGHDARGAYLDHEPFTLIVTSPPYLNGTNYGRNTKLELLALGFLDSERDLDVLREREITAGINNVSKRTAVPREFPDVEALASRLDEVAYDRRIPAMIRAYFSDMHAVLEELHRRSAGRAQLWLDIGDSRYSGVSVPTHSLLVAIAQRAGWIPLSTETLRQRRSYDGAVLTQSLIRLEREAS